MNRVISIYEAKTNLSKLVKQASAGETIYVGAYGQAQAIITALPKNNPTLKLGIWKDKKIENAYDIDDLVCADPEITDMFDQSSNNPLV